MLNKILVALLIIAIAFGIWKSIEASKLKDNLYIERIENANRIAELDSVRQIGETKYARLSQQFIKSTDKIKKLTSSLHSKDAEILSLAQVNSELSMNIDTLRAEYKEDLGKFQFMRQTDDYLIMGTVRVDSLAPIAYVIVDSLIIPVRIEIMFIKYDKDDRIELQVETNSKFVSIKNLTSYIKVPRRPIVNNNWSAMIGPVFGSSYGGVGILKYKNYGLLGGMFVNGWNVGLLYNFYL